MKIYILLSHVIVNKKSMVTCPSEQKILCKKYVKKNLFEKTEKNRLLFSIPKPKPIPTETRHSSKKPVPIPTDVKKSIPQGSIIAADRLLHTQLAHHKTQS
jgi:hypothetical protein